MALPLPTHRLLYALAVLERPSSFQALSSVMAAPVGLKISTNSSPAPAAPRERISLIRRWPIVHGAPLLEVEVLLDVVEDVVEDVVVEDVVVDVVVEDVVEDVVVVVEEVVVPPPIPPMPPIPLDEVVVTLVL